MAMAMAVEETDNWSPQRELRLLCELRSVFVIVM